MRASTSIERPDRRTIESDHESTIALKQVAEAALRGSRRVRLALIEQFGNHGLETISNPQPQQRGD